jgi:hypothetical protein
MAFYENDEIKGYQFAETKELVCIECATDQEIDESKESELITEKDMEGKIYYCDRCK